MQAGDNLGISVQLIDAPTNKLIWAEQYDRKMADLLATQREIATTLTQKMQLRLKGDRKQMSEPQLPPHFCQFEFAEIRRRRNFKLGILDG